MNGPMLVGTGVGIYALAYFFYGKFLKRFFGVDAKRETPAHTEEDGVDFVPARGGVVFGHHFASIAGAGPIVGPILACYFGWVAVAIWLIVGCIFVGAFHDFAAVFLSVRNRGRSIAHIIEQFIGFRGRLLFLAFCWAALVLVVTMFAKFVVKAFIHDGSVATASMLFVGLAPLFGVCVRKLRVPLWMATLVFVPMLAGAVWVGVAFPVSIGGAHAAVWWYIILFAYAAVASILPVWVLLQPRDYLNAYLLYAMVLFGVVGIVVASPELQHSAFVGWKAFKFAKSESGEVSTYLFPLLFVTVACGACSGFHSLVASGTTSKQISSERQIVPIGYGAMLVEGVLGLMALVSVAYLSDDALRASMTPPSPTTAFASGLAAFGEKLGLSVMYGKTFVSLAVSAFLLTTLDTATRLARFTWQELWMPKEGEKPVARTAARGVFSHRWFATGISVLVAVLLVPNGAGVIWPVFGASNQLLAALTLLVVVMYLASRRKAVWIALIPMLVMVAVSESALLLLFIQNLGLGSSAKTNYALVLTTGVLLVMSGFLLWQGVQCMYKFVKEKA